MAWPTAEPLQGHQALASKLTLTLPSEFYEPSGAQTPKKVRFVSHGAKGFQSAAGAVTRALILGPGAPWVPLFPGGQQGT